MDEAGLDIVPGDLVKSLLTDDMIGFVIAVDNQLPIGRMVTVLWIQLESNVVFTTVSAYWVQRVA